MFMLLIPFYYKDTSVLLENIPPVKFIKITSATRVVYYFRNLTREFNDDVISVYFPVKHSCLYN